MSCCHPDPMHDVDIHWQFVNKCTVHWCGSLALSEMCTKEFHALFIDWCEGHSMIADSNLQFVNLAYPMWDGSLLGLECVKLRTQNYLPQIVSFQLFQSLSSCMLVFTHVNLLKVEAWLGCTEWLATQTLVVDLCSQHQILVVALYVGILLCDCELLGGD
jgi:hypothetical protein